MAGMTGNGSVRDRYDHLDPLDELEPWVARVKSIEDAGETYVISNNHNLGKPTVNALQLASLFCRARTG